MRDALVLVDVIGTFRHEDGERLAAAFVESAPALRAELDDARMAGVPVLYVNDADGDWSGSVTRLVERATTEGLAGDAVRLVAPHEGEAFLFKLRYSGFDHTALEPLLRSLEVERLLLAGTSIERCVAQTAIAARERDFKVTVLAHACPSVDEDDAAVALHYLERIAGCRIAGGDGSSARRCRG